MWVEKVLLLELRTGSRRIVKLMASVCLCMINIQSPAKSQVCLSGVSLRGVSQGCLSGVSLRGVSGVSLRGVSRMCLSGVSLRGVSRVCLSGVSLSGVSLRCVSRVCFVCVCSRFLPRCMECQHGLATRILSVCLCQTRDLWQNERMLCPDFYTIQKITYPSFLRRRMELAEGDPFCLQFHVNWPPLERNRQFSVDICS